MFRRIATMIDVADVVGLAGLALLAYGVSLFDPRGVFLLLGAFLVVLAVARAQPSPEPPAPRTE
jgi:hypothetical protein